MQQRMIDDAGGTACCVGGGGDVADLDVSKICSGASLWLLGVTAAPNVGFTVLWFARLPAQLLHRIFSNDIF
jgi:hypothetical protein